MKNKKNILVCPLDWGLGHATRCIPIINKLQEAGFNVVIAADGRALSLLSKEFPAIKKICFTGYNISYPSNERMACKMLRSVPKMIFKIYREHKQLKKIIHEHDIDIVISDNRYGLWNKRITSIFISHQLMVKFPKALKWGEYLFHLIIKLFINQYDECWVPDYKEDLNLSGDLAHKYKVKKTFFIGPLTRLIYEKTDAADCIYDVMIILSGPEPQRTIFETMLITQLLGQDELKAFVVRGMSEEDRAVNPTENIDVAPYLNSLGIIEKMKQSKLIIARSGYSTIMDLVAMEKSAILVPTPGQTEQEYLAKIYHDRKWFYSMSQKKFNLKQAISDSKGYTPEHIIFDNTMLLERIARLK